MSKAPAWSRRTSSMPPPRGSAAGTRAWRYGYPTSSWATPWWRRLEGVATTPPTPRAPPCASSCSRTPRSVHAASTRWPPRTTTRTASCTSGARACRPSRSCPRDSCFTRWRSAASVAAAIRAAAALARPEAAPEDDRRVGARRARRPGTRAQSRGASRGGGGSDKRRAGAAPVVFADAAPVERFPARARFRKHRGRCGDAAKDARAHREVPAVVRNRAARTRPGTGRA